MYEDYNWEQLLCRFLLAAVAILERGEAVWYMRQYQKV